ncbi:hypothetical protein INR49_032226 [Caranx melampygus]|nr:hypothetical protein INR49_032226 [Caranx melampygus]
MFSLFSGFQGPVSLTSFPRIFCLWKAAGLRLRSAPSEGRYCTGVYGDTHKGSCEKPVCAEGVQRFPPEEQQQQMF